MTTGNTNIVKLDRFGLEALTVFLESKWRLYVWWFFLALANIAAEEGAAVPELAAERFSPTQASRGRRKRSRQRRAQPAIEAAVAETTSGRQAPPTALPEG